MYIYISFISNTITMKKTKESVNITTQQMDVIKHILDHVFTSLHSTNDPDFNRPDLRIWQSNEYAGKLLLTNEQFKDLDKVIKIFA